MQKIQTNIVAFNVPVYKMYLWVETVSFMHFNMQMFVNIVDFNVSLTIWNTSRVKTVSIIQ